MRIRQQGWVLACFLLFPVVSAWAQSAVTPEDEYKKLIRVDEEISPLGDTPFGEHIDLYGGSLSFEQTDVSLAGDGPLLQLSRTFELRGREEALQSSRLGFPDWELNIPRITTLTSYSGSTQSWQVNWPSNPDARCTHFGAPPRFRFHPPPVAGPGVPASGGTVTT